MPIEQMNISLSPQMARFIRGKVKKGEYSNISEVVRDAVRRMQEREQQKERPWWVDFELGLSPSQREDIRRSVAQGIEDIQESRYEEYDEKGLDDLSRELVANSQKKFARRPKRR